MATLMFRRLSRPVKKAATFSRTVDCYKKEDPGKDHKGKICSPDEGVTLNKVVDSEKIFRLLNYHILYNPSAYTRNRRVASLRVCTDDEECEDSAGSVHSSLGTKQAQNTYSITCSRRLSSSRNTLLDLVFNKADERQVHSLQSEKLKNVSGNEKKANDTEVSDAKEDARAFQKLRTDYKLFCYNANVLEPLSAEDCIQILHKVTVLKSKLTPEMIAEYFKTLGCLPPEQHVAVKSDTRFAMLCRYSVENLSAFHSSQLIDILKAFVYLKFPPSHSLLNVYEVEFSRRVWDMDLNQLLLIADLWRFLGRSVPQYLEILFSFASLHWKNLSLPQLVQLIYIIGEARKAPPDLMQKIESLVLKYIDEMNLEEVGAVCLGFFKSKSRFSEYLMRKIGEKVALRMVEISNFALVNVLKMFRFTHVDHLQFLNSLGQVAAHRIPSMGTQGIMHIALACAALHFLDEKILDAIAAELPSKAPHCRSKDAAKFMWSFASLNYEPPNSLEVYEALTAQLRLKLHEFEKFPEHLLTGLLALAFAGHFPHDLIDFALSPTFVKLATEVTAFELKKDLLTLDASVGIECLPYKGNRISPLLRREVTVMMCAWASTDLYVRLEVAEALSSLQTILGGPHYVKQHMILPHTRSCDLEVHLQMSGKPVPFNQEGTAGLLPKHNIKGSGVLVTDELMVQLLKGKSGKSSWKVNEKTSSSELVYPHTVVTETTTGKCSHGGSCHSKSSVTITPSESSLQNLVKSKNSAEIPFTRTPKSGVQKLAVQVTNRNHYCYGSHRLLGLHSMKRRQLCKLGYVVVEIPFWEWFPLLKRSRSEKLAYLHQKVFGSFDEMC
ncbi:FAST kinase domain-containing protein 5, mitochondrial [Protopterus annectens]|uniref:FAST kinase domain-containing protein 5, mitochondrial n=1 Tax=Protopterus annectens TaxID=7888 RepID=UPI001CFAD600|nr:FAST kinase domain-containing protein 5, mitochondrial [Protopterus annectens]XP_043920032.1 FAST kinase domain-containing protein 5, mitochondrial [Protopterus annectens]